MRLRNTRKAPRLKTIGCKKCNGYGWIVTLVPTFIGEPAGKMRPCKHCTGRAILLAETSYEQAQPSASMPSQQPETLRSV